MIAVDERVRLPNGLVFPFYPMRPTSGRLATPARLQEDQSNGQWLIQPKRNGDRVTIFRTAEGVMAQNRHLGMYRFKVLNLDTFKVLPVGSCLDGEVLGQKFYPFETLAYGNDLMLDTPVEWRAASAKRICQRLGVDWLFEAPGSGWFEANCKDRMVEGWVKKRLGSKYAIMGTETDSSDWFKVKWPAP